MKYTPIFYMGGKSELIERGLVGLFPKDIDTFYDLFCGSGVVSVNVRANKKVLNDLNIYTLSLIKLFNDNSDNPHRLVERVEEVIKRFDLPTICTNVRAILRDDTARDKFEKSYRALRDYYNNSTEREPLLLYILSIYSFSHIIRFNKNGYFNMPIGNSGYIPDVRDKLLGNAYKGNYEITCKDFRDYTNMNFRVNDFIYLDPPYLGTNAIYNENNGFSGGWSYNDDADLFAFCDKLNKSGIKFGLSNVFKNKDFENMPLQEWVIRNGYSVHHFDNFTYSSCGKGSANSDEVFICNYELPSGTKKKRLF